MGYATKAEAIHAFNTTSGETGLIHAFNSKTLNPVRQAHKPNPIHYNIKTYHLIPSLNSPFALT